MTKLNVFRRAMNSMIAAQEARARTLVRNYVSHHPELAARFENETPTR